MGYDFQEVDAAINDYKETISNIYELLTDKEQYIAQLKKRNDDLSQEIVSLRMQLEAITIPEYAQQTSENIIDEFANNGGIPAEQPQLQNTSTPMAVSPMAEVQQADPTGQIPILEDMVPTGNENESQPAQQEQPPQNKPMNNKKPVIPPTIN